MVFDWHVFFCGALHTLGVSEFKGVVLVEVLYISKDTEAFTALCVFERRELPKFGSNCSVDPIFQDILSMIEAISVFCFVSVVSGVTMGLGSFVAGDPIGEVAGEVGEVEFPKVESVLQLPGSGRVDSQEEALSHNRIGTKVFLCLEKVCYCHRRKRETFFKEHCICKLLARFLCHCIL